MPISNLYSEYATIDAQIAALEIKKDQLRPHIIKMMTDEGTKSHDIGVGKFSISKRKTWSYSDRITEMNDNLKAAKAKEESTGDATFEEVDQLRYTTVKL